MQADRCGCSRNSVFRPDGVLHRWRLFRHRLSAFVHSVCYRLIPNMEMEQSLKLLQWKLLLFCYVVVVCIGACLSSVKHFCKHTSSHESNKSIGLCSNTADVVRFAPFASAMRFVAVVCEGNTEQSRGRSQAFVHALRSPWYGFRVRV